MKFAVIQTGGKQYKVTEGQTLVVEKLPANVGKDYSFDKVLLVADKEKVTLGAPNVKGASVSATVKEQSKHEKVLVVKYKSKSRYFKRRGHRQPFTAVEIKKIDA